MSDDGYITLDESDDSVLTEEQRKFLESARNSKTIDSITINDFTLSPRHSLHYDPPLQHGISLDIRGNNLVTASIEDKLLRINVNNNINTIYIFQKKPKLIQKIFLKIIGIKWTLEK